MGAFGVVVMHPGIEVAPERSDTLVERFAYLDAEELVEDGAVEALDEAVGFRVSNLRATMLDAVQVEIEFVGGRWIPKNARSRTTQAMLGKLAPRVPLAVLRSLCPKSHDILLSVQSSTEIRLRGQIASYFPRKLVRTEAEEDT